LDDEANKPLDLGKQLHYGMAAAARDLSVECNWGIEDVIKMDEESK
jgi:hypothetical protein